MAKLKAPLMSLGASGKLGGALVFFPWKGINAVRTYVIPANPQTDAQQTQRGYITDIVEDIHEAQAYAARPLDADDIVAYRALAGVQPTARTWFNELCKQALDQWRAGDDMFIGRDGTTTPGANQLAVDLEAPAVTGGPMTAGDFWYGVSPTALINSQVAVVAIEVATATLAGLVTGQKTYWQFRPTAPAGMVGSRSGIYYGYPT